MGRGNMDTGITITIGTMTTITTAIGIGVITTITELGEASGSILHARRSVAVLKASRSHIHL